MLVDVLHRVAYESQPPMQDYRPRPSGWGRCIRASVYHALGYPAKLFPGRFVMLLEDSSFGEDLTIDWIRKTAFRVHSQQMEVTIGKTAGGAEIHGSIDGILEDLMGKEYLLEHKAIGHFPFERLETCLMSGTEWDDNLAKWANQGCAYLRGIDGKLAHINDVVLVVKNKNTSAYIEVVGHYSSDEDLFTVTSALTTRSSERSDLGIYGDLEEARNLSFPNIYEGFVGYFNRIEEYASKKTLPPRPYSIDSWQCSYCSWQGTCWSGYEAELSAMAEGVDMPEDLEPMVQEYRDLTDTEGKCDKRKKELKSILLNECEAQRIKKCRSQRSGLSLSLSLRGRDIIDPDLVPAAIREKATKRVEWQEIRVSKPKGGKG